MKIKDCPNCNAPLTTKDVKRIKGRQVFDFKDQRVTLIYANHEAEGCGTTLVAFKRIEKKEFVLIAPSQAN